MALPAEVVFEKSPYVGAKIQMLSPPWYAKKIAFIRHLHSSCSVAGWCRWGVIRAHARSSQCYFQLMMPDHWGVMIFSKGAFVRITHTVSVRFPCGRTSDLGNSTSVLLMMSAVASVVSEGTGSWRPVSIKGGMSRVKSWQTTPGEIR